MFLLNSITPLNNIVPLHIHTNKQHDVTHCYKSAFLRVGSIHSNPSSSNTARSLAGKKVFVSLRRVLKRILRSAEYDGNELSSHSRAIELESPATEVCCNQTNMRDRDVHFLLRPQSQIAFKHGRAGPICNYKLLHRTRNSKLTIRRSPSSKSQSANISDQHDDVDVEHMSCLLWASAIQRGIYRACPNEVGWAWKPQGDHGVGLMNETMRCLA